MKSLGYKTQVIFFWLVVLVITFVIYSAKEKLGSEADTSPVLARIDGMKGADDIGALDGNSTGLGQTFGSMLNSSNVFESIRQVLSQIHGATDNDET